MPLWCGTEVCRYVLWKCIKNIVKHATTMFYSISTVPMVNFLNHIIGIGSGNVGGKEMKGMPPPSSIPSPRNILPVISG